MSNPRAWKYADCYFSSSICVIAERANVIARVTALCNRGPRASSARTMNETSQLGTDCPHSHQPSNQEPLVPASVPRQAGTDHCWVFSQGVSRSKCDGCFEVGGEEAHIHLSGLFLPTSLHPHAGPPLCVSNTVTQRKKHTQA